MRAYENTRFYRAESTLLLFCFFWIFTFLLVFVDWKSLDAQNIIKKPRAHLYNNKKMPAALPTVTVQNGNGASVALPEVFTSPIRP